VDFFYTTNQKKFYKKPPPGCPPRAFGRGARPKGWSKR
jgi:hypothetical protein